MIYLNIKKKFLIIFKFYLYCFIECFWKFSNKNLNISLKYFQKVKVKYFQKIF